MYYAGIGSRETPEGILAVMRQLGAHLAAKGYTLRSGGAPGADMAFEAGCDSVGGAKQIFIPWPGFQNRSPALEPGVTARLPPGAMDLTAKVHPAWARLKPGVKKLHARNCCQVLGPDLETPSTFVICWTPGAQSGGGTGQAIRLARSHGIKVFDLADEKVLAAMLSKVHGT